jgi:hypothetical protein
VHLLGCGPTRWTVSTAPNDDDLMMIDPDTLIADFGDAAAKAGINGWPCPLRFEVHPAPHQKPKLPPGQGAVYVFAIGPAYGASAPCGPRTVLKVGEVGPTNKRRFTRSHYRPTAPTISTLAQSLLAHPILWPWLGIEQVDADTVEKWMLDNLDRTHFFMPGDRAEVRDALEVYVRGRVGSVFEGVSIGAKRRVTQPT